MRYWKTIRQRRRRARAGQVSAVAVVLGLLLVVTFIANYLAQTLPSQMQELEFEHTLQVEDQLGRIQTAVLAEATHPHQPLALTSPVTLGSQSLPPFAPASTGSLVLDPASFSLSTQYSVARVFQAAPHWGMGSACLGTGNGTCLLGSGPYSYNASAGNSTFTVTIAAASSTLFYNISGSGDTLSVSQTGATPSNLQIIVVGSNDTVTVSESVPLVLSPHYTVQFFGQNDQLNALVAGAHSGPGTTRFLTSFAGDNGGLCPFDNGSASDTFNLVDTSNAFTANSTWWNSVGYVTAPATQALLAPNSFATFQNRTGFLPCGFTRAVGTIYTTSFLSGLKVHLANRYNPPEDILYEDGAVILSHPGSGSFMTGPPTISIHRSLLGAEVANFTIVNVVGGGKGSPTSEGGTATAGVSTQLLSVDSFQVQDNSTTGVALAGLWLNLTTPYPDAWAQYLNAFPPGVLVGGAVSCSTGALPSGFSCLIPPSGQLSTLSGELLVSELDFSAITVAVTIQ
ncbi:MAG: hypothetical protein L3K13_00585 [Thermoplasmata archaeon]|nr:hypothetical protein [Thermoplasmata archaeon]